MKFCVQCGNQLTPHAKFCKNCGNPIEVNQQTNANVEEQNSQLDSNSITNAKQELAADQQVYQDCNPEAPENNQTEYNDRDMEHQTYEDFSTQVTHDAGHVNQVPNSEITPNQQYHEPANVQQQSFTNPIQQNQALQETQPLPTQNTANPVLEQKQLRSGQKGKKKSPLKIMLAVLIPIFLIVGGGVAAFFYLKNETDPVTVLENFKTAVESEDYDLLGELLTTASDDLQLTDAKITELVMLLNENQELFNATLDSLEGQATDSETPDYHWITLEKSGKKYYLFDKYVFQIQPVYFVLDANFNGTNLLINGSPVGTYEDQLIRTDPFMPGEYEVKAEYNGEYGQYEKVQTISTFDYDQSEIATSIEFEGQYVTISATDPSSMLYLNGTSLNKTVAEVEQYGPVTTDGSMTFHAVTQYPWGDVSSNQVAVTGDMEQVELAIDPITPQLLDELMFTINEHVRQYIRAYRDLDVSEFTYMINEDYLERIADNFEEMQADGWGFQGDATTAVYDLGSVTLQTESGYVANILVELGFDSSYYPFDENPADFPTEETSYIWNYELTYDESQFQWFITNSQEVDSFETSNLQTYEF